MKILRLTIFQNRNAHTGSLFKNRNILELSDKLVHENYIIISKSLHKTLPKSFVTGSFYPLNLSHIVLVGHDILCYY